MSGKKWTEEDEAYLRENYGEKYLEELAEHLQKSYTSIANKANRMGLRKDKKRHREKFSCDYDCFNCKFDDCMNGSVPTEKEMKMLREAMRK